jgi:hypothetical protein
MFGSGYESADYEIGVGFEGGSDCYVDCVALEFRGHRETVRFTIKQVENTAGNA